MELVFVLKMRILAEGRLYEPVAGMLGEWSAAITFFS
jgi:hypothetical protein